MAQDPYKYFRIEARELLEGLTRGILELEKGSGGRERVNELLRLAHTLKGASRVVKQSEIGDLAHAIEDSLAPFREGQKEAPQSRIDEILRHLDAIGKSLAALDPATAPQRGAPARPAGEELLETVRIELGEMDTLLEDVTETTAQFTGLESGLENFVDVRRSLEEFIGEIQKRRRNDSNESRSKSDLRLLNLAGELDESLSSCQRSLSRGVDRTSKGLLQIRERVNRFRLLPASVIFASLERAVRDAAQSLGKRVEFQSSGGENRLDAHVLVPLRDALFHVVRNSVAHGIEPDKERLAAGKESVGRVALAVERQGNRVTFACRDDGRGIDVDAVRKVALQKGLLPAAKAGSLTTDEAVQLLMRGGVSTTGSVTDVSGRGIGLDVLRETVQRLKGEVSVRSEKGRGTTFRITVPVSLSSLPAILVEAGGAKAAIPLDAVPATRRVAGPEVSRSTEGDSVLHDGKAFPVLSLSRILSKEPKRAGGRRSSSIVIVRSGAQHAAVEVDRVLGVSNVVVRSLPSWVAADPVVAGVAMDSSGLPQIVLDPAGLVHTSSLPGPRHEEKHENRLPILIVDDSLTTRMLEQSILESDGYEVVLAVSGEDALSRARDRKFGLFLVDIEMPGMDGFDFIARTRSDPSLRDTPAILVTSRNSPEDRKRAEDLGASGYVVKSEFDQGRLLKIIQELMG